MHCWICAIRIDIIVPCVFAHREGGSPIEREDSNEIDDLFAISMSIINSKRNDVPTVKYVLPDWP